MNRIKVGFACFVLIGVAVLVARSRDPLDSLTESFRSRTPASVVKGESKDVAGAGMKERSPAQAVAPLSKSGSGPLEKIAELVRVPSDFRVDVINSWIAAATKNKTKEEREAWVHAGIQGYRSLDAESRNLHALQFAGAFLNQESPDAVKFIEILSKKHASDPVYLVNLLLQVKGEEGAKLYPETYALAGAFVDAHQGVRLDPSIKNFKTNDPAVRQAIEGSKFVGFQVQQMSQILAKVRN
jgi:hypothetical protein